MSLSTYLKAKNAVNAQIWYLKYTQSGPLHFKTADSLFTLIYGLSLEHEY